MQVSPQEINQFLHDLRTPLSVIKLMLEVMSASGGPVYDGKNAKNSEAKNIDVLQEETLKLQNLIEAFSKKATMPPKAGERSSYQEPPQGATMPPKGVK